MAEIRFWRPEDLPELRLFAVVNAWQILPPDDRAVASIAAVAEAAEGNLMRVLGSPGSTAVVAVEDGRPVGYLLIGVHPDDKTGEPVGYMADIYVEPQYRKGGLGARFHDAGEAYLRQIGVRRASLWTHAHNQLGQRSAIKQGYRMRGVMLSRTIS